MVLAALVAGIIGTSYGLFEANRQTVIARGEKNKAIEAADLERQAKVREAERAAGERQAKEQVAAQLNQIVLINETILGIFSELNVRKVRASNEPVEALLSKKLVAAGRKFDSQMIQDPKILATLQNQLGVTLVNLGDASDAIDFFTSAKKIWTDKLGSESDEALTAANNLAGCYQANGKSGMAIPLFEELVNRYKTKHGLQNEGTIDCMNNLAECYRAMGKLDLAIPLMEETLQAMKSRYGPDAAETLIFMNNQAVALRDAGKLELALPLYEDVVKLSTTKFGGDHPNTLLFANNLALGYKSAGKMDQAIRLYRETLNRQMAKLGRNHPDTLVTMNNLAMAYRDAGQLQDAIPLMEETLNLRINKLGKSHLNTLTSMNNLAVCYKSAGKMSQAISLHEETLKLRKEILGSDHPETLLSMLNLAQSYEEVNRMPEAIPLFESAAIGIERRRFQSNQAGAIILGTAGAYEKNGQFAKAEEWRRKWLAVVKGNAGINSSEYARDLSGLGSNLLHQQKWGEAEKVLRDSLAVLEKQEPVKWTPFQTRAMVGYALLGQKKFADAETFLLKAYDGLNLHENTIPAASKGVMPETLDRLVELYNAWDKRDEAEKYRQERKKYPEKK